MIQIAAQIRILVAVEAIDGRKGIDAIAQLCREKLNADPFSGYLFIFRTRRGTAIRVLQFDGQGFWLATKRLSKGRFKWWPTGTEPARTLRAHQAQLLIAAGNPEAEAPRVWRPLNTCVRGGGRGYQNGGPLFANVSPRLSLLSDHLRTVLAVKGSLRRAQQRRALDGSGPFRTTLLRRGKGSLRTARLGRGPLRRHFGTLFLRHRQVAIVLPGPVVITVAIWWQDGCFGSTNSPRAPTQHLTK